MNSIKYMIALFICITSTHHADASRVEFTFEDVYSYQAPQEINTVFESAATLMNYTKDYEIASPKKAGIQINPWNQFVASGTHPVTKNTLAFVNPEFFSTLSDAEKTFMAARVFAQAEEGIMPWTAKIIPWIWVMLSWLIAALLFISITKYTRLVQYPWWARAILVWAIIVIGNSFFGMKLQEKWRTYVNLKHDTYVNELVIAKTGDRDAAISAFEKIDAVIKANVKTGEPFFKPYENLFANAAKALKKHEHKAHTGCCGGH